MCFVPVRNLFLSVCHHFYSSAHSLALGEISLECVRFQCAMDRLREDLVERIFSSAPYVIFWRRLLCFMCFCVRGTCNIFEDIFIFGFASSSPFHFSVFGKFFDTMITRGTSDSSRRRRAASSAARSAVGLPVTGAPSFAANALVPAGAVSASASVASGSVPGSASGPPPLGSGADAVAQDLMMDILGDPNVTEDGDISAKAAEPVVGYFVDHLKATPRFARLAEEVDNPCHFSGCGFKVVPRAFAVAFNTKNWHVVQLMNAVLIDWQENLKMKRPDPATGCPFYKASSQSKMLRVFLATMTKNHGWLLTLDDFSGFEGCLTIFMKDLYTARGKAWVSIYLLFYFIFCTIVSNLFYIFVFSQIMVSKNKTGFLHKISIRSGLSCSTKMSSLDILKKSWWAVGLFGFSFGGRTP